MEEIDLKELFEYVKNKLGLIIVITAGICLLGCIYGLVFQKPMYKSYTTVILGSNATNSSQTITQTDITINRNLVDTYAQIVTSRRVLDQVINELNLDISYESLKSKISVSAVNNTEIIKINAEDKDAIKAKNIANITANYFKKEIVDLYNMNNVNILDEAIQEKNPYNINIAKQIIVYFMIGLILAIGIVFVVFYFDRTIKSAEQVEQKIKLPILGSIEEYQKGGKK
ncbi:MAG: Wzz/FepE/Etk N-terminal domain-containing protein [bacterium]|nr:Wzz/FepE/Etk N-terminal domain-containing protein [bacterium]